MVQSKEDFLRQIGHPDLARLFKGRPAPRPVRTAQPLDQRIAISITSDERKRLLDDMHQAGVRSASRTLRSRAMGAIDIELWRNGADRGIETLTALRRAQPEIRRLRHDLTLRAESGDHDTVVAAELDRINERLAMLSAANIMRPYRIAGRVTAQEAAILKWRAGALCLPVSDYLRMVIFDYTPFGDGDMHMGYDARLRFYVSVVEVATHGWGTPPDSSGCPRCILVSGENDRLRRVIAGTSHA